MRKLVAVTAFTLTLAAHTTRADESVSTRTPTEVVNHHIAAMLKHDPAALVADYADDAVVVLGARVYNGKQQIQKLFGLGTPPGPVNDDHAKFNVAEVDGDIVIEEWSHDSTDGGRVSGADVIVVRNGKIAFHTTKPIAPAAAAK